MKIYILLLSTALMFTFFGCSKFQIDESSLAEMTECAEGVATTTEPCVVMPNHFVYDAAYGGRSILGANQTTANGSLSRTFPTGWYEGNTATVVDSDLLSTNITVGTTIFGVTGDVTGIVYPLCTAPGQVDGEGKILNSCEASTGQYVYEESYGGRGNICVEETVLSAPCWLPATGRYIITDTLTVANCTTEGIINTACVVAANKYWYTSQYGGRTAACPIDAGTNGTSCWTGQPNTYIRNGNSCSLGYNGASCFVDGDPDQYVYTTEFGGRNVLCTSNNVGSCWFAQPKNVVETNLSAANIKLGETIFGINGTFTGVLTAWGSGMSRTTSTTVNVISYTSETTTYSAVSATALPSDYHPVPRIGSSDDAYNLTTQVSLVDRTGWGATTCGTAQANIGARIADCAVVFGANATWDGRQKGHNGEGVWRLVTRTGNASAGKGREVWQDQSTGLMWSSVVSSGLNWCKASGSSNSAESNIIAGNFNEDDPNDICDNSFYQNQTTSPISACEDAVGFSSTDPDIDNGGKAGLSRSSTPKVAWRIPTIYDYMVANHDGLRFVMPDALNANTTGQEWTATIDSTDRLKAWLFDPTTGTRSKDERSFNYAVRCIGR